MDYSMEERSRRILAMCLQETSKNPIEIFCKIAKQEFIRIHGRYLGRTYFYLRT